MNQCSQMTTIHKSLQHLRITHKQNQTPSLLQTQINAVLEISGAILTNCFLIKEMVIKNNGTVNMMEMCLKRS